MSSILSYLKVLPTQTNEEMETNNKNWRVNSLWGGCKEECSHWTHAVVHAGRHADRHASRHASRQATDGQAG